MNVSTKLSHIIRGKKDRSSYGFSYLVVSVVKVKRFV